MWYTIFVQDCDPARLKYLHHTSYVFISERPIIDIPVGEKISYKAV